MPAVLDQPTLVLNKNWTAIDVEPVRDAVTKVCSENAVILDPHDFQTYTWEKWSELAVEDEANVLHTARGRFRVPDIIILNKYEKVHSQSLLFNRRNLFARDNNTCQYCGKRMSSSNCTVDHVIPQCQGGPSSWENCVIACVDCNVRKGGRTPRQAGMQLIRKPAKPRWSPMFRTRVIKPVWGKVLPDLNAIMSEMYWQVELQK